MIEPEVDTLYPEAYPSFLDGVPMTDAISGLVSALMMLGSWPLPASSRGPGCPLRYRSGNYAGEDGKRLVLLVQHDCLPNSQTSLPLTEIVTPVASTLLPAPMGEPSADTTGNTRHDTPNDRAGIAGHTYSPPPDPAPSPAQCGSPCTGPASRPSDCTVAIERNLPIFPFATVKTLLHPGHDLTGR